MHRFPPTRSSFLVALRPRNRNAADSVQHLYGARCPCASLMTRPPTNWSSGAPWGATHEYISPVILTACAICRGISRTAGVGRTPNRAHWRVPFCGSGSDVKSSLMAWNTAGKNPPDCRSGSEPRKPAKMSRRYRARLQGPTYWQRIHESGSSPRRQFNTRIPGKPACRGFVTRYWTIARRG